MILFVFVFILLNCVFLEIITMMKWKYEKIEAMKTEESNPFYDIPVIKETVRDCTSTFCKNEISVPNPLAKIIIPKSIYTFIITSTYSILITTEIQILTLKIEDIKINSQKFINTIMQLNLSDKYINLVYEDTLTPDDLILVVNALLIKGEGIFIIPYSVFLSSGLGLFNTLVVTPKYISLTEDAVLLESINNGDYDKSTVKLMDFKDEISQTFKPFICLCGGIFENIKHLNDPQHEAFNSENYIKETQKDTRLQQILESNIKLNCSMDEKFKLIINRKKQTPPENIILIESTLPDYIQSYITNNIKEDGKNEEGKKFVVNSTSWNNNLIDDEAIEIFNNHLIFYENKIENNEGIEYEGIELNKNGVYREIDILLVSSVTYRYSTDLYELYTSKKEWEDFGIKKLKENILFYF